ncbi:DUF3274 domain-containing protein [Salmonella enterica]
MNDNIRNPKFLSVGDICRPVDSGEMLVQPCAVKPPLPCIVILVHGVNDVGEAYENQDQGICDGLNQRLGRTDLHAHEWKTHEFMISDADGNVTKKTCSVQDNTCIGYVNRSPTIPFYWGYKPVDHATWQQDQQRYRADLVKKPDDADLPYDTYREIDTKKIKAHGNENIDNLNNWLDPAFAKGGGTFANATTNIPDMFGHGAVGAILEAIGKMMSRTELTNDGDWSHPIYQNPHRIYQAYAARRLADLIIAIRRNEATKYDTINIVAHSQGTIITMLANMWVAEEGLSPADCTILNHSPYALENRWLENFMPGNQQTSAARQKTLANFCRLMAKNSRHQPGGGSHDGEYIQALTDRGCLSRKAKWDDPHYNRNNFGMVYNYFCPNDQVVSMSPIQGFGWRGIPDNIRGMLGDNLRQRVFCKGIHIGDKTGYRFEMPARQSDDPEDTGYSYRDVTIDAPVLPDPFEFTLMAQEKGYKAALSGNDPKIARAAMKAERFIPETVGIPDSPLFYHLGASQRLSDEQLAELSVRHPSWEIVKGIVSGQRDSFQQLIVYRRMTDEELNKAIEHNHPAFSQHSSIVANKEVSAKSTAYDLAIGRNNAFEDKGFWERLLLRADWRRPGNPVAEEKTYYQKGILPPGFKPFMNKPERPKGMPVGYAKTTGVTRMRS